MQSMKYLALLSAVVVLLSVGAFAKNTNSGSFDLTQPARVGTTELSPGHYKAEWLGPNGDVHITIVKNGKEVADVQGRIKRLPSPAPYSAVTLRTMDDQRQRIEEIDFGSSPYALVLSPVLQSVSQ
jgi:hypothetical protein